MARTNVTALDIKRLNQATATSHAAKLAEHDAALDAVCDATGNEHLTANGAVSPLIWLTTLAIDSTKTYTLAAGTKVGQRKRIRCTAATNTPAGAVTGTYVNGVTAGTSLAFNAAEDLVDLVWNGTAWAIAMNVSVVLT